MKEIQIKETEKLEELPRKLFDKINNVGLLTGSKVFGGWKKGSDIEYIFVKDLDLMKELAKYIIPASGSVSDESSFYACYARYKGSNLNFIVVEHQKHFDAWKDAHDLVITLIETNEVFKVLMEIKEFRVKQFQLLREVFGWSYEDANF